MRQLVVGGDTVFIDAEATGGTPTTPTTPLRTTRLMETAAGLVLSVDADSIRIDHRCAACGGTDHGAPLATVLVSPGSGPARQCPVSIARAGGQAAAIASSGAAIGIDIESIAGIAAQPVGAALLHPAEESALERLDPTARGERLAWLWVAKESLVKATGHGLRVDLRTIRLAIEDGRAALLQWPAELGLTQPPRISLFRVDDDIVGAITTL